MVDDTKAAYAHAFVVLAASAAVVAGRPHAEALLADAMDVVEQHFWDDAAGMRRASMPTGRSRRHRGANANMHSVEAFLAADALGERGVVWRERAARIVELVVASPARRVAPPEHFTPDFVVLRDYNTDDRAHPFRPYGVTPGHLFEWARLCLHLLAAEAAVGSPPRDGCFPTPRSCTAPRSRLAGLPTGRRVSSTRPTSTGRRSPEPACTGCSRRLSAQRRRFTR